jgi:hypothetical protein
MGGEISSSRFEARDFEAFAARLSGETALLAEWFREGVFANEPGTGGFELEAWLIDTECQPAPINAAYLERLASPLVVPELARFNVEINSSPRRLRGDALRRMQEELEKTWQRGQAVAAELNTRLLMIGILPTVGEQDLCLANMSDMKRYRALNEQVLRLRGGRPLQLDIQRDQEHLRMQHHDVMLESAATSFQIHLQIAQAHAARYYNAALIASAPMVAVNANAPFLFGHALWDETRIPLFEQAVEVGGREGAAYGPMRRVTFGTGYARESLLECFTENEQHYPPLLPIELDDEPARLSHLRLHNGTIWRWNRPLVGFGPDGRPHLRIEHRVVAAGPTVVDEIANAALFFGLAQFLAHRTPAPELQLSFAQARDNFYAAARNGLDAQVTWLNECRLPLRRLLAEELLPMAHRGLEAFEIDREDRELYLGVIEARVRTGRNGAAWQRAYAAQHGRDMQALTAAYAARQHGGRPVHEWDLA